MLHRYEAFHFVNIMAYILIIIHTTKENMQRCCLSLRRVSLTVSPQRVFFQQERTSIFGCRCVSERHRAVRKNTHAGLQRIPNADLPSTTSSKSYLRHKILHFPTSLHNPGETKRHRMNFPDRIKFGGYVDTYCNNSCWSTQNSWNCCIEGHKTFGTVTNECQITPRWRTYISKYPHTISYQITSTGPTVLTQQNTFSSCMMLRKHMKKSCTSIRRVSL